MKTTITHAWEPSDPSRTFVKQALHRLQNIQQPSDEASLRPYRRAVEDGSAFTERDIKVAACYLREMAGRAEIAAQAHAAKRTAEGNAFAEEMFSAAHQAREAAAELLEMFKAGMEAAL